ncbi:hypothetical protein Syun_004530 [Stephania yunnanensis]|uniref:Uncharacterized protein n=1 Tax=Stephania yunnanensis TaxID=152371 RepID=A0AAP0Q1B6_9MAGN
MFIEFMAIISLPLLQVSADLSIVDLDVSFNLAFSVAATMNTYVNLGVLFVSVPMVYFAISLQVVIFCFSNNQCDKSADNLPGTNLTSSSEKSTIRIFVTRPFLA